MRIQEHMYNVLFEKKNVACRLDLYMRFYPILWPCEDMFREFLVESDSSIQMSTAKGIYSYIGVEEDVFLPQFTWKRLIQLQQKKLVNRPGNYIPQDHVIHSVSLYILGIYAFFNLPVFQRKLLHIRGEDFQTEEKRLLQFIKKWKLFAFYHDIGYVFEAYVDSEGKINDAQVLSDYLRLKEHILAEYVSRSVSRLIIATALVRRNGSKFHLDESVFSGANWITESGESQKSEAICQKLENCQKYRLLEDIQSMEGFRHLSPFLSHVGYLAVVEDLQNRPLALFQHDEDGDTYLVYYHGSMTKDMLLAIKESLPLYWEGITIRYYLCVESFWQKLLEHSEQYQAFRQEAQEFDRTLPENLSKQFSLICNDSFVTEIFYRINEWHHIHWHWESGEKEESKEALDNYQNEIAAHFSQVLNESVHQIIQTTLQGVQLTAENLQETIDILSEKIKEIDISEIQKNATYRYERAGVPHEILKYSSRLYKNLLRELNRQETVPYLRVKEQTLFAEPFSGERENSFAASLYDRMEKLASALKLELKTLIAYRPDFSTCDHGVFSAGLLFQALTVLGNLEKTIEATSPLEFAWSFPQCLHKIVEAESISLYADVVFSILLHNVYVKSAKPKYGLQYQQDIDQNPFSYFCALMDILQKWNRPKQIDFSVMDLPDDHYLGNSFDVNVSKGRLRIVCHSSRAGRMRQQLDKAEEYLPGILNLICVTEEER